jgi:hypothetical protein
MRQEEVEAILRGPPGDFTSGEVFYSGPDRTYDCPAQWRDEQWSGDEGQIVVMFDEHGAARFMWFEVGVPIRDPLYEKARSWLRNIRVYLPR